MEPAQLLFILVGLSIPIAIYLWRDIRYRNPAIRWRQLAPLLGFDFENNPPRIGGKWKGRQMVVCAQPNEPTAVLTVPLNCPHSVRLEIGPRADVERDAGIVVPDRVVFHGTENLAFEKRFLVRSTPLELGQTATDMALRQRLLGMKDVRILAVSNRLDMVFPIPTEVSELRDWLDVAESLADAIDGT